MITLRRFWEQELRIDDESEFAEWFLDVHIILQKMEAPSIVGDGPEYFNLDDIKTAHAKWAAEASAEIPL